MIITIDERNNEILFFMAAESIEDSELLMRMAGEMVSPNTGYVQFYSKEVCGWIAIPTSKKPHRIIKSGRMER